MANTWNYSAFFINVSSDFLQLFVIKEIEDNSMPSCEIDAVKVGRINLRRFVSMA